MKDIKKFRGLICDCADVEDKYNTISLLEDYQVLINEKVLDEMYNIDYPNLTVENGQVKHYRELREEEDGVTSTYFINKLINCNDVQD